MPAGGCSFVAAVLPPGHSGALPRTPLFGKEIFFSIGAPPLRPRWGRALREPGPWTHPRRGFHPLDPRKAIPLCQRVGRSAARTRLYGSDNWRRGYFLPVPRRTFWLRLFSAVNCPSGAWRRGYGGPPWWRHPRPHGPRRRASCLSRTGEFWPCLRGPPWRQRHRPTALAAGPVV